MRGGAGTFQADVMPHWWVDDLRRFQTDGSPRTTDLPLLRQVALRAFPLKTEAVKPVTIHWQTVG
jgi:hypothetical protein